MAVAVMCMAILISFAAHGQEKENTLGGLWPKVEESYLGIRSKEFAVDAARLDERAVKANMLPQLKAQVQNTYGTYNGTPGAFFPQTGLFNVGGTTGVFDGAALAPNVYGSSTVEWEIFSFGKLHKENEAAHTATGKSLSEKEVYLLNLKKILSQRYISLLFNESKLRWNKKNVDRLNEIRKITAGLSAAGLRPAADSLLALSSYTQALGENDRLKGNRAASLIRLLELYPVDTVDYELSVKRFSEAKAYYAQGVKLISPSHPVLSVLDKQSRYLQLKSDVQKSAALPSLRFIGGYAYRGTGIGSNSKVSGAWKDGFSNTAGNVIAGIGITWNITDLHTKNLNAANLLKEAQSASLLREQYEQSMQAELSASQSKIIQQFQQLTKTSEAVKQSQEAYNMYLARYKSGLITLSELLQIQILVEQAENNHIEASREYWLLLAGEALLTAEFDFLFNNL